jgi:mRNA interferase MazF
MTRYQTNRHTGLAMVCPITNTDRKMPFHVSIPAETNLTDFAMVEQVKSVDYVSRKAKRIDKAPAELLEEVLGILDAVLY